MKLSLLSLSAFLLALTSLTSCESLTGGNYDAKYPTREEMLQLDRQWGLPDIQNTKPRAYAPTDDDGGRAQAVQQAPQPKAEAPVAAEPEKPKTQSAPPLPDPATLQKLR
jgi:hypothetical protein